jgi:hypothetical protein
MEIFYTLPWKITFIAFHFFATFENQYIGKCDFMAEFLVACLSVDLAANRIFLFLRRITQLALFLGAAINKFLEIGGKIKSVYVFLLETCERHGSFGSK